jgi:hypothetical protein
MSYEVYKILHIFGVVLLYTALGGVTLHAMNGGTRESNASRAVVSATHGVALLLVLVAGFGMLAKLGLSAAIPGYVWAKVAVWLLLGAAIAIVPRQPGLSKALWWVFPVLGAAAAWLAVAKPF